MAKSKRGGSSDIAVLGLAPRSAPPNAKGALVKARTIIVAARDFIELVTIKRTVWFAIGALSPRQFIKDVFKTDVWEREVKIQPQPTTAATATASRANPQAANSTNRARRRCASAMHARRVVPATISWLIRRSN